MKNSSKWRPTKFVQVDNTLRASTETECVAASSRLNVDLLAASLLPLLARHVRGELLDLGCGNAPLYGVYGPLAKTVTCVDWPSSSHDLLHVDQTVDLNTAMPFQDESFDTIVFTDVLEHLEQPHAAVREIARILRPSGVLVGSVPFMYWLHEQPHDNHRFTEFALRRMAENAGFRVEHLEPYGAGPDVLFDLAGKLLHDLHWRWGPVMARTCHRVGLRWHRHSPPLRRWRHLPLGYAFAFSKNTSLIDSV